MKSQFLVVCFASLVLRVNSGQCQSYEKYVKSFTNIERGSVIDFERIVQSKNRMSKDEAVKFVYSGDTSKLSCVSQNINMITEKKGGLMRSLRMPSKCMLLNMEDYTLIAYTSFECQDPKKTEVIFLHLKVLNKALVPTESKLGYRDTFEFPDILGEINSKNGLIFLAGYLKTKELDPSDRTRKIYAQLLTVDKKTFRFRLLKESADIKGNYTNFLATLKALGWQEIFNGN